MAWVYLAIAAAFEIAFAASMKASHGFTKLWPSALTVVTVAGGISCLTLALKSLPVGVGYPVWVGIGTVGTVILGAVLFEEPLTAARLTCVALILVGVIGLKLTVTAS